MILNNFQKIRLIIYLILFGTIIQTTTPYQSSTVNKDIEPYYNEFKAIVDKHCSPDQYFNPRFKIDFTNSLPEGTIGVCITYPRKFLIYIDRKFWEESSELVRFQLIAHEASHCHLLADHVQNHEHYMYYSFVNISKDVLYYQIVELLKENCK